MDLHKLITDIIVIPREFKRLGNVSYYTLLKESGYFTQYAQVSEEAIYKGLIEHPECIQEWIQWSEDKRTSSGWYIAGDEGQYEVRYFDKSNGFSEFTNALFSDKAAACSAFIKREIESTRLYEVEAEKKRAAKNKR